MSRPLLFALIAAGLVLALMSALLFQAPELLDRHKVLTDFDAFHIAGRLAADGRANAAYHIRDMLTAQREASGTQSFMPWTYPPPFTLMMQGLASLPIGLAFVFFTLSSFAFYLWVLRRIAGETFPAAIVAVMPAVILNLRTGQNGFLIAGLIGSFLLVSRDKRMAAGLPLGLLIIKPHLAAGVGLVTLLQRRWPVLCLAAAVALSLLGLSTWAYGMGIWSDFGSAVREASGFLAQGYYPLYRMSSIYAAAYTLGFGAAGAMALQVIGALAALGLLGWACLRGLAYRHLAALTCAASLFVSPYGYDYDLTILGVGLAFVIPDLLERCSGWEVLSLLLMSWFVCGFGLGWSAVVPEETRAESAGVTLIAPMLVFLCWRTARLLCRSNDHATGSHTNWPAAGAVVPE
ncbi:glycosyltransferase family 87 protein [Novosphingobium album (ex Hu et al. 2023)]|uniref:DUF2029 domain-containing protein n=1 Tax=Novosphingobium album (ex Hu et al. 2023) TaxID=2930093 RepID=A0ABT0B6B2_9SPHN|nr:glycosyltransferase family 87 protein [Novosphingobium album (ex Hu et al. 2023)]MCJ2180621.1 DUF2029 domain-containing protein [Novosphingobium album (ex Hu et al. 2023)]